MYVCRDAEIKLYAEKAGEKNFKKCRKNDKKLLTYENAEVYYIVHKIYTVPEVPGSFREQRRSCGGIIAKPIILSSGAFFISFFNPGEVRTWRDTLLKECLL